MDGSQPETLAIEDVTHTPCAIPGSYLTAMTMGVLRKDMRHNSGEFHIQ